MIPTQPIDRLRFADAALRYVTGRTFPADTWLASDPDYLALSEAFERERQMPMPGTFHVLMRTVGELRIAGAMDGPAGTALLLWADARAAEWRDNQRAMAEGVTALWQQFRDGALRLSGYRKPKAFRDGGPPDSFTFADAPPCAPMVDPLTLETSLHLLTPQQSIWVYDATVAAGDVATPNLPPANATPGEVGEWALNAVYGDRSKWPKKNTGTSLKAVLREVAHVCEAHGLQPPSENTVALPPLLGWRAPWRGR